MSSKREILNFNDNWGFFRGDLNGAEAMDYNDSAFAPVSIPHTMRLEKKPAGDVKDVFQGIGWYRRYFTLDKSYEEKQIRVDFDGVMMECDVYLNGEKICSHQGGYMGFSADITGKVRFGEKNALAVRVVSMDNEDVPPGKPLANVDFHYYGGIYRNVRLRITDNLFITDAVEANEAASGGVFASYPLVSRENAVVSVKTHVQNSGDKAESVTVKAYLEESGEDAVCLKQEIAAGAAKSFVQEISVQNPRLWHPDEPNLYTLACEVYRGGELVDCVKTKIGIRRIEMKPEGFFINGERLYLRGSNRHQCYAFIGDAASDSMQVRDVIQMKENGFNSVRAAHYPQSPAFLDACDELGMLVIECQPGWQQFTESKAFYDYTIRDAREMVRRDRNHPCVFLWEASLNETHYSAEWAKDVTAAAHEEYPGDQFFTAADYGLQGEYYDVNYKAIDGDKDNAPDKAVFTREWGDLGGYHQWRRQDGEYFMLWQVRTHQDHLNGTGGYPDWGGMDAGERLAGHFMWSWNDYARGYNSWMLPSGCVDVDRSQKYLAYWLSSMLPGSKKPMVFIASRNDFMSGRIVNVFSNCDEVELYQGKRLLGRLSRNDKPADIMLDPVKNSDILKVRRQKLKAGSFVSNVPNIIKKGGSPIFSFKRGAVRKTLTARAYIGGKEVATHTVHPPKFASKIAIIPSTRGIAPIADGSDLIPVYFKFEDKNGSLVPYRYNKIHICVSGEGELVGKGISRIKAEHQYPSGGIAFAFVRTTKKAGKIKITAHSGAIKGECEIETAPYCGKFVPDYEHSRWLGDLADFENGEDLSAGEPEINLGKQLSKRAIKNAFASCESERGRGVDKLFDGERMIGTGWLAKADELPQSVTVEFKRPQNLTACQLFWEKDSSWYTYSVEVSRDGREWFTALAKRAVGGQETNPVVLSADCRDIKFAKITLHDVASSGAEMRIGMSEIVFFSK